MNLFNDIDYAKKCINNNLSEKLNSFTSNNLIKPLKKESLHDKKVLVIDNTGDIILNLITNNCTKIENIPQHPLSKYYYELKKAIIKNKTLEEYIKFFSYYNYSGDLCNPYTFDKNVYNSISNSLKEEYKYFWDELFETFDTLDIRKELFNDIELDTETLKKYNNYFNEDDYKILQKRINSGKLNYYESLFDVENKYNIIFIHELYDNLQDKNDLRKFKKIVDKLKNDNLEQAGKLFLAYTHNEYEFNNIKNNFKEDELEQKGTNNVLVYIRKK